MIIIGHSAISYPRFIKIASIADITQTKANEIVWFSHDDDENYSISTHCRDNEVAYAVRIESIKEAIIYAQIGVKYILIDEKYIAENVQKIANDYFFDSKILYVINDEGSIENIAMLGIDGVIFNEVLE